MLELDLTTESLYLKLLFYVAVIRAPNRLIVPIKPIKHPDVKKFYPYFPYFLIIKRVFSEQLSKSQVACGIIRSFIKCNPKSSAVLKVTLLSYR